MQRRVIRIVLMCLSSVCLVAGLSLTGFFGIRHAEQTIWLNHEQLSVYHPARPVIQVVSSTPGKASALPVAARVTSPKTNAVVKPRAIALWVPRPATGSRIGTLKIPSLSLSLPIVQGSDEHSLSLGVGHDTFTALPGQGSNIFLAGHRDTVFSRLKGLKRGDRIVFTTPYGDFVYQTVQFEIVPGTDVSLLAPTIHETLTLSTCYPFNYFGAAPDRYIVLTKLVSEPSAVAKRRGNTAQTHS